MMGRMMNLYRIFDKDGELLYVGISLSTMARLAQHKVTATWFGQMRSVSVEHFSSRTDAEEAERQAIRNERPVHNKIWRKSTPDQPKTPRKDVDLSKYELFRKYGWLYFIGSPSIDIVNVNTAVDIEGRLSALRTTVPSLGIIVAIKHYEPHMLNGVHHMLDDAKVHADWFTLSRSQHVIDYIKAGMP